MKACIAVDDWKLDLFRRRLVEAGYEFTEGPGLAADTRHLYVEAGDATALARVVGAANAEAAVLRSGVGKKGLQ